MELYPNLHKNGYSIVPAKLLFLQKQLKITDAELLFLLSINRHRKNYPLHLYIIGNKNGESLQNKNKKPYENKASKLKYSLEKKHLITSYCKSSGNYKSGLIFSFENLNKKMEEIKLELRIVDYRYDADETRWSWDVLKHGFIKIPNFVIDNFEKIGLNDKQLCFLFRLCYFKENYIISDKHPIFNHDSRFYSERRRELKEKRFISFRKYGDGFIYNFLMDDSSTKKVYKNAESEYNIAKTETYNNINNNINKINLLLQEEKDFRTDQEFKLNLLIDKIHNLEDKLKNQDLQIKDLEHKLTNFYPSLKKISNPAPFSAPSYENIEEPYRSLLYKYNRTMSEKLTQRDLDCLTPQILSRLKAIEPFLIKPVIDYVYADALYEDEKVRNLSDHSFFVFVKFKVLNWMYNHIDDLTDKRSRVLQEYYWENRWAILGYLECSGKYEQETITNLKNSLCSGISYDMNYKIINLLYEAYCAIENLNADGKYFNKTQLKKNYVQLENGRKNQFLNKVRTSLTADNLAVIKKRLTSYRDLPSVEIRFDEEGFVDVHNNTPIQTEEQKLLFYFFILDDFREAPVPELLKDTYKNIEELANRLRWLQDEVAEEKRKQIKQEEYEAFKKQREDELRNNPDCLDKFISTLVS